MCGDRKYDVEADNHCNNEQAAEELGAGGCNKGRGQTIEKKILAQTWNSGKSWVTGSHILNGWMKDKASADTQRTEAVNCTVKITGSEKRERGRGVGEDERETGTEIGKNVRADKRREGKWRERERARRERRFMAKWIECSPCVHLHKGNNYSIWFVHHKLLDEMCCWHCRLCYNYTESGVNFCII